MAKKTRYLKTCKAAKHLGMSVRTLERYRLSGGGPVFHRFRSGVRYLRADLDSWAATRRRNSTSDDGPEERPGPGKDPAPPGSGR